jgi:hypothetical protein
VPVEDKTVFNIIHAQKGVCLVLTRAERCVSDSSCLIPPAGEAVGALGAAGAWARRRLFSPV